MNVSDLTELHYITPIANVPSILKLGILSNREIARRRVKASSIALPGVQERRDSKVVPGAKPLHEYVNLYICARNPMMYLRRAQHQDLCVLQISPAVLDLPNIVIADGNAARFRSGLIVRIQLRRFSGYFAAVRVDDGVASATLANHSSV